MFYLIFAYTMIYKFQLKNTKTGETAEIEAPSHWTLESLSPKIKVAMRLPYNDYEYHRFHCNGKAYMTDREIELTHEYMHSHWPCGWRCGHSESMKIHNIFTPLGSAVNYRQGSARIHCTLIERIA